MEYLCYSLIEGPFLEYPGMHSAWWVIVEIKYKWKANESLLEVCHVCHSHQGGASHNYFWYYVYRVKFCSLPLFFRNLGVVANAYGAACTQSVGGVPIDTS